MKAHDLLNAFESLDTELLYAARAEEPKKRRSLGKLPIAAAIVLLLLSTAVLYGIFIAPAATIFLDSRESVTVSLNSRGNVLSAKGYPQLDGEPSAVAVEAITRDMLDSGAINENENTLILGTRKQSEKDRELLLESVKNVFTESRFHGAIISLSCSDTGAKAEVIDRLCGAVDSFTADSLRDLSANDLNLLLHDYEVSEEMELIGSPSEGMYIGKAAAKARAEKLSDLNGGEIAVIYSVYHRRMVYLVTIIRGDRGEAYFINAADGTIENAVKTTAAQLQKTIRTEVGDSNFPVTEDSRSTPQIITDDPQTFETADNAQTSTDPPDNNTPQPTTAPIPPMTEKPKESPATEPQRVSPVDQTTTAPPVNHTPQPPTALPSNPLIPSDPSSNETTTTGSTETPMADLDSLIVDIPYSELISYPVIISNGSYGQSIPLTSITPFYQWQMNWRSVSPPIPKSQVNKMGKQDKCITVFCTYDDFATYSFDSDSEWNEYLQMMQEDKRFSEEFFRENALVMVWYSDFNVYTNEVDSICSIETNEETAYVSMLREYRPEATYYIDTDVYKCVVSAVIKKSDIQKIKDLKLIVMTQSKQ